ncbi:putative juvenile hormone acid methyltransferase [Trypoxylus dichotomus]
MACAALWAQTSPTKIYVDDGFNNYGHLLKWKAEKETVLEIGCGDGFITREILYKRYGDHIKKLIAIDKLDSMIEYAKSFNKNESIDFVTMDIKDQNSIEKMKGCFDHIFTFYTIHWITDSRSLMRNFYDILKPSGQVFISIMVNSAVHESFRRLSKKGVWCKYVPVEQIFADYTNDPVKYVTTIMQDAGFKVVLCTRVKDSGIV